MVSVPHRFRETQGAVDSRGAQGLGLARLARMAGQFLQCPKCKNGSLVLAATGISIRATGHDRICRAGNRARIQTRCRSPNRPDRVGHLRQSGAGAIAAIGGECASAVGGVGSRFHDREIARGCHAGSVVPAIAGALSATRPAAAHRGLSAEVSGFAGARRRGGRKSVHLTPALSPSDAERE